MDLEPEGDSEANVMLSGKLDGPAETEPGLEPEAKVMLSGRLDALETVADPEPKVILNGRTETVPDAEFREREAPEMTAEPDALIIDSGGKLAIEAEAERLWDPVANVILNGIVKGMDDREPEPELKVMLKGKPVGIAEIAVELDSEEKVMLSGIEVLELSPESLVSKPSAEVRSPRIDETRASESDIGSRAIELWRTIPSILAVSWENDVAGEGTKGNEID